jgi:hypothetical protein
MSSDNPKDQSRIRPLSALISNLGALTRLSRNSFGTVRFSPISSEPRITP